MIYLQQTFTCSETDIKVQIHDIDNVSLSVNNSGNSVNFHSVFRKYFTTRYPTRFLAQRSLTSSSLTNFLQLNLATYNKIIGDELYSFVSRWSHFGCWLRRFDCNSASLHEAMRSIVYVSLFLARWFVAIGVFRSSLLFRLADGVLS